ncbi:hypothetical protein OAF27_02860 [Verrucomicrobiales bacterium]|nr:hypothetical protein [Verrucomicrobiales bacterium]
MSNEQAKPHFSLLPGWIILGVGLLSLLVLGIFSFLIAGPAIIIAIILSIIGMTKDQIWGGIALLLAALILPSVVFFGSMFIGVLGSSSTDTDSNPDPIEITE